MYDKVVNKISLTFFFCDNNQGDNIQTAVSVARDCKILSRNETVISITVLPGDEKIPPKIYFNLQGAPVSKQLIL